MEDIPLRDLYTRDYFRGVGRAWERFLSACSIDAIGVRDVVLDSWRRCVEQGVDPRRSAATVSVAGEALDGLYRANDALYEAIKICVAPAVRHLAGTRTVLITSDARGTLLTADGDPPLPHPELGALAGRPGHGDCRPVPCRRHARRGGDERRGPRLDG